MFRLSQAHLNLLAICPPKFKQSYLIQGSSVPNPESEEKQIWGSRFHLLMQQRELGLPIEPLLKEDSELDRCLKALIQAAPELLTNNATQKREAEHSRTVRFGNYLLTVIYDLLIVEEHQGKIIDWKTYLKPRKRNKLAENWQTRLYLYVLAKTSNYLPEQLSMTYWFVRLPDKPQSQTFFYNEQMYHDTEKDLKELLSKLDQWLESNDHSSFPHHHECELNCPYAQELFFEHKADNRSDRNQLLSDIENILEIPL
jgi:PD-(D/E)XK nuclease superfamily